MSDREGEQQATARGQAVDLAPSIDPWPSTPERGADNVSAEYVDDFEELIESNPRTKGPSTQASKAALQLRMLM